MSVDLSAFGDVPTVGAAKNFKYVKAKDENGQDYYMPCTAAVVLGDEAVGVILRVLEFKIRQVVKEELEAALERQFSLPVDKNLSGG